MPRYAELIYNGFWFAPERVMLQAAIDATQRHVTGTVRLKLYKGVASVVGRKSPFSLYNQNLSSFEDDGGLYNQKVRGEGASRPACTPHLAPSLSQDAEGFIKLQALRLRTLAVARGV